MKDKTYCPGTSCGIRFNCRRYIAPTSKNTIKGPLWWTEPLYNPTTNDCTMYKAVQ